MIEVPKLVVIILIAVVAWYAMRWWNRAVAPKMASGRQNYAPRREAPKVEDLTACRVCGAYVAAGAPACGKPGCPLLR